MRARIFTASLIASAAGVLPLLAPSSAAAAAPTATVVVSDTALRIGETSPVTITFSEAVTGLTVADMTVANGSLSGLSTSDNISYVAILTPSGGVTDASNVITLNNAGVVNGASEPGTGTTTSNNYLVDTVRPTATVVVADSALIAGETSLVTVTFSEAVNGFTNADLTVPNGTLSSVFSSDGGLTWSATLTPTTDLLDASNVITLSNAGVADLVGNAGLGTTTSNNYAIDTLRPTAFVVVADTALSIGETTLVTIAFSGAVSGFGNADLTVVNGTLSSVSSSDGGVTWTATLTPGAGVTDTTNVVVLDNSGVVNAAGNAGTGTTSSNNYAIDTTRPTATIAVADSVLGIGETSLVTVTFSEAVNGFTNGALTVDTGTVSSVSSSDGGITWTATFTPSAGVVDSSNLITLANSGVSDLAGNAGTGTTSSNSYAIDTIRPTATIVVADSALTAGETSLVTVTFSEPVSGFTNADLTVPNGTLSSVFSSDGGIGWSATFTPGAGVVDATNLISLANSGVSDLAGNAGSGTTDSGNFTISTVRPTATVVVADSALSAGETSLVTVTFSEAVSGFSNADLTVANGTLSAVSSSDGGVTWTATFTPTAGVSDATNVITLDNTGVVNGAGNPGTGTTTSNSYAIDSLAPGAVVVVAADSTISAGETSAVTISFSEAVSGFTSADLTVPNGTLNDLDSADGGSTWTAVLTPASVTDATNVITLDLGGVTDLAGNAGTGTASSNNYAIDSSAPSSVASGPQRTRSATWSVTYEVADDTAVASVALFARGPGEEAFGHVVSDTADQDGSFTFTGSGEGSYAFYTVATDAAGNVESLPQRADVTTVVDQTGPRLVSPMGRTPVGFDLSEDNRLHVRLRVVERSTVVYRIVDSQGVAVRRYRAHKRVTGLVGRTWNGRNAAGNRVSPGRYRLVAVARDAAGNRTRLVVPLRVIR